MNSEWIMTTVDVANRQDAMSKMNFYYTPYFFKTLGGRYMQVVLINIRISIVRVILKFLIVLTPLKTQQKQHTSYTMKE
jgi:hypothetical protein